MENRGSTDPIPDLRYLFEDEKEGQGRLRFILLYLPDLGDPIVDFGILHQMVRVAYHSATVISCRRKQCLDPRLSRGNGFEFGKLSTPGRESDTPTQRGGNSRGRGRGSGARTLVERALGTSNGSARKSAPSSNGSPSASPQGTLTSDNSNSPSTKRRRRQDDRTDKDWESEWNDGKLGGNVVKWGKEMDREDKSVKRALEREEGEISNGDGVDGGGKGLLSQDKQD